MRRWIVTITVDVVMSLGYVHPFGNSRVEPAEGLGTLPRVARMPANAKAALAQKCAYRHSSETPVAGVCADHSGVVADRAGYCRGA